MRRVYFCILYVLLNFVWGECTCPEFTTLSACQAYQDCLWNGSLCYQPQCTSIKNQEKCMAPNCSWILGKCYPPTQCEDIMDKFVCGKVFGCIYNDGFCLPYETCSYTSSTTCKGKTLSGLECRWNAASGECFIFNDCNKLSMENCEVMEQCINIKKSCKDKSKEGCGHKLNESECDQYRLQQCVWNGDCNQQQCDDFVNVVDCTSYGCTWMGSQCNQCNPANQQILSIISIIILVMFI